MNPLRQKSWSPYIAGSLIGVLSWFAFASVDQPIGVTTPVEHAAALTLHAVEPELSSKYFEAKESEGKPPKIGWEAMLVIGVFLGALVSSILSDDRASETVPPLWCQRFGGSGLRRLSTAFLSGGLMMFGARLAQGCTSGHGISGALQFAVSSWVFVVVAFGIAIAMTFLLFGKERAHV